MTTPGIAAFATAVHPLGGADPGGTITTAGPGRSNGHRARRRPAPGPSTNQATRTTATQNRIWPHRPKNHTCHRRIVCSLHG